MSTPARPDDEVLAAFGLAGCAPEPLPGGRGLTWRVGPAVVRPVDRLVETTWRSGVLDGLARPSGFRVPRPLATATGDWAFGGWEAWSRLPGAADESRVLDVVDAGESFHRAIAALPRPSFLDTADGPWARADRMAWEEEALPRDPALDALRAAFRPVSAPSQLIHGDLLGNVLFADGAPPAIIDWPPYWRPTGFATAIAVVDAVCWHGASLDLLSALAPRLDDWDQLLVRALVFRIATLHLLDAWDEATAVRHRPVVRAVLDLAR